MRPREEQEWAETELRNALRSIEWDLEDLDDTVQIVEKNPAKFRIDGGELAVRKSFIAQTREEVRAMTERTRKATESIGDAIVYEQEVSLCLKIIALYLNIYIIIIIHRADWNPCPS